MPLIYLNTASGEGQKVFEVVPAAAGGGDNARSRKERGWVSGMVGITGYSLAGLFAVYAIYRTDVFSGGACPVLCGFRASRSTSSPAS